MNDIKTEGWPSGSLSLWVQVRTLISYELIRIIRLWQQTLLPPGITTGLYFILFGHLMGQRIGLMGGVSYSQFIAPGLIMMHMMIQSYSNVSSSFFSEKFMRNTENLMIAPLHAWTICMAVMIGGMCRGIMVACVVTMIAFLFTTLPLKHIWVCLVTVIESTALFALLGLINALYAKQFDDIMIIPSFVMSPLFYLGGVFYSLTILPSFWQHVSLLNPVVYLVEAFRYSTLGIAFVWVIPILVVLAVVCVLVFLFAMRLLRKRAVLYQL